MSEKRFTFKCNDNNCSIFDNGVWLKIEEIVDLLNEQNRKIKKLERENGALGSNVEWFAHQLEKQPTIQSLKEENERLREELSECEKFRYSVFKRIEKTIEDKDNCVLNKDAKSPCKDYDECLKRQGTNKPLPCVVNWMMGRPFENMLRKEGDDG